MIGGFSLPNFGCGHRQHFSTSRRSSSITNLGQILGEPEDLAEFFCQRLSSLSLTMPSIQPADKIECSRNAGPGLFTLLSGIGFVGALFLSAELAFWYARLATRWRLNDGLPQVASWRRLASLSEVPVLARG